MEVLRRLGIKATFFSESLIALTRPELLREIARAGHEVACHSYSHYPLTHMPVDKAREDVQKAISTIEDAIGARPQGFRAPRFMINDTILAILEEEGFLYDSSIIPSWRIGRYRHLRAPRRPFFPTHRRELVEIPVSVLNVLRLPLGLPWLNKISPGLFTALLSTLRTSNPMVFYMHPHDLAGNGASNLTYFLSFLKRRKASFMRTVDLALRFKSSFKSSA